MGVVVDAIVLLVLIEALICPDAQLSCSLQNTVSLYYFFMLFCVFRIIVYLCLRKKWCKRLTTCRLERVQASVFVQSLLFCLSLILYIISSILFYGFRIIVYLCSARGATVLLGRGRLAPARFNHLAFFMYIINMVLLFCVWLVTIGGIFIELF